MDDDRRMAVASFAERGGAAPKQVPDRIRWAFAVQDDDVVKRTGEYARRLAEMDESEESDVIKADGIGRRGVRVGRKRPGCGQIRFLQWWILATAETRGQDR